MSWFRKKTVFLVWMVCSTMTNCDVFLPFTFAHLTGCEDFGGLSVSLKATWEPSLPGACSLHLQGTCGQALGGFALVFFSLSRLLLSGRAGSISALALDLPRRNSVLPLPLPLTGWDLPCPSHWSSTPALPAQDPRRCSLARTAWTPATVPAPQGTAFPAAAAAAGSLTPARRWHRSDCYSHGVFCFTPTNYTVATTLKLVGTGFLSFCFCFLNHI